MLEQVLKTIDQRRDASLEALKDFLRIPSISTRPEHQPDMARCAQWIVDQLKWGGLDVSAMPTKGHPIVVAKNRHEAGRKTVLLYGHYDVQPPEPLAEWVSAPFDPTVRNGAIYARGAADDKGQVWAHLEAILCWQAHGGLPVNLTVLLEGEEEIGSEHLPEFIQTHRQALRADICIVSDTNQFARGLPAITYGLRGLVYMEVKLTGADHDLHSGLYGGAVPNAANVLCELLGTLHDAQGRVNLPGFYDDVAAVTPAERAAWQALPFDENQLRKELNVADLFGESGFSTLERKWARPTCDINGLTAGYQGPGAKTVIGSTASAKVSMRLVPSQSPVKIAEAFEATLRARCPKHTRIEIIRHSVTGPVLLSADSKPTRLAARAMEIGFGVKPAFIREGGSIPIALVVKQVLGIDTIFLGFSLPDDRIHSPNEKFDLDALYKGTRTAAAVYRELADL